jgi:hypothetical protein
MARINPLKTFTARSRRREGPLHRLKSQEAAGRIRVATAGPRPARSTWTSESPLSDKYPGKELQS